MGNTISLDIEVLEVHLAALSGYVQELNDLAGDALGLVFGDTGGSESAGPCAGKANELNKAMHDLALGTALVIESSVTHLNNIKNDIVLAATPDGG